MRRAYPLTLGFLLLLVFGVNTRVDLAGTGSRALVEGLAARQIPDEILVAETDFDQRSWVRARLRSTCPETLIAGSSTVGGISAEMLDGRAILNAWMTGPTLEDYEALITVLDDVGCRPREVLLGVDPWLLDRSQRNDRWLSLHWELVRYQRGGVALRELFGPAVSAWATFKERLSFVTTFESIRWLWQHREGAPLAAPRLVHPPLDAACAVAGAELRIRYADGHFVGCPRWALDPPQVEAVARAYTVGDPHGVVHAAAPDAASWARLGKIVRRHRDRGADVILYTPPYHPTTYAALMAMPKVRAHLAELDAGLARIAVDTGARFARFRDPAEVGCAATDFADSHHARPSCLQKEMRRLAEERARP